MLGQGLASVGRLAPIAVLALLSMACSETVPSGETAAPADRESVTATAPEGGFTLDIEGELDGETLTVVGSTDLPDRTEITVSAQRAFLNLDSEEDNPRAASAGMVRVTVEDGGFLARLSVNESLLLVGIDLPGEEIAVVSDVLTVCAVVETGVDVLSGEPRQPDPDVRAVLGENGEALEGSAGTKVFGAATESPSIWLEVAIEVPADPPVSAIEADQGFTPEVRRVPGFCGA